LTDAQLKSFVLFLDRNHGNLIRERLIELGFEVKACNRMFPATMLDVEWIAECAKHHWVILTGDKSIEEVPAERQAVIDGKCKVFMFEDTNSSAEDWVAALMVGRQRILHVVENSNGPLFITIRKFGHSHFSLPRFVPDTGSGWKPERKQPTLIAPPTSKKKKRKQQRAFWEEPDESA
jgi:hypothetical protein